MTPSVAQGARLLLPLRRLQPSPASSPRPAQVVVPLRAIPRQVDLDAAPAEPLAHWLPVVQAAAEAALLVDAEGRVVAMSARCAQQLALDASLAHGALLVDLLTLVDFTAAGVPLEDAELQVPPLRALRSGSMARSLMRVRRGAGLVTFDVVGVPLQAGTGALAFLTQI